MFIPSFRDHCPLFAVIGLVACQHAAAPATSAGAPARATISTAPTTPAADSTPTADPEKTAPDPEKTAPISLPNPFIDVVRLDYQARLDVAGRSTYLSTERLLLRVQGDSVQLEPALLEGLTRGEAQFPSVIGDMPAFGWALQIRYMDRTSRSTLSRWTGSEWVNADGLLQNKNVIAISPWSNGRTLALVSSDEKQLYFTQFGGTRSALPQLTRTAHDDYNCVHGLQPAAMNALPSGEVYLAGTSCAVAANEDMTTHGVVVHSWAPGATRAKVSILPGLGEKEAVSGEITSIVAASGSDVFVAGERVPNVPEGEPVKATAYIAHFDGKSWRAFSAPPIERIEELQRAPNGSLWALLNGELWTTLGRASENATWQHVELPREAKEAGAKSVSSFWVQDDEQVWATLGFNRFTYLVRTKRVSGPLSMPSDEQIHELSKAFDPAATHACARPTLVLLTLSRNAPKNADMPSVRAALRGHPELAGNAQFIELPFLTRRYLAARGDLSTLRIIREILEDAKLPGVEPEMRCLTGDPARTLELDFSAPQPETGPRAASQSKAASPRARMTELNF